MAGVFLNKRGFEKRWGFGKDVVLKKPGCVLLRETGVMTSLPVGKHTYLATKQGVMTSLPVGKHTVQRHDIRVTSGVVTSLPVGKHTYLARSEAEVTSRHLGDTCVTSLPPRFLPAITTCIVPQENYSFRKNHSFLYYSYLRNYSLKNYSFLEELWFKKL